MRKALRVIGALIGFAALAPFAGNILRRVFEKLPDEAPPKWMFNNITAIRENTDRILDLLQREPEHPAPPTGATTSE